GCRVRWAGGWTGSGPSGRRRCRGSRPGRRRRTWRPLGSRAASAPTSRQPSLPSSVVLHVPIALALADTGQAQIELLDVLVLADRLRVTVQHDPAILHDIAMLGNL